jgi:hypothetical protein
VDPVLEANGALFEESLEGIAVLNESPALGRSGGT